MTGGSLATSNFQSIGSSGTGTFTQSGGTNSSIFGIQLGVNGNDSGTYILSDTGVLSVQWYELIGEQGSGIFSQSGGMNTLIPGGFLGLGHITGSSGSYNLSGGSLSSGDQFIGDNGTGVFTQSGGTNTVSGGNLVLGASSDGNGTYNLSSGQLFAGDQVIGDRGTGVFTQSGGTNTVSGGNGNFALGASSGGNGTYNLNGGTLVVSAMSGGPGSAQFNFGGGMLKASDSFATSLPMKLTGNGGNANVDTAMHAVTFEGQLSGSGGLNIAGDGILTLSGSNSYQGPTTVTAGSLNVANTTGSATGSGAVTVSSIATLAGSGSIAGPVTITGTLSPGNSVGTLIVDNRVMFQPGSTFRVEVNGLAAGSGYDQLSATGPVSLAGSLALTFGGFTPTDHDILFLIDNTGQGTTTGTFQYADNSSIGIFNGYAWYITYDAQNGAVPSLDGGNDLAIYSCAVPEPGSLVLSASGMLSVLAYAWRQRKPTA